MKYTKNSPVVDAVVWTGDNIKEIEALIGSSDDWLLDEGRILLSYGYQAFVGDYIVKNSRGRVTVGLKSRFLDHHTEVPVPEHEDVVHTDITRREVTRQMVGGNAASGGEYWWFFKLSQSWTNGPKMDADTAAAYKAKYLPDCTEWSILPGGQST